MGVKRNSKDDQPNHSADRSENKPTMCDESYVSFCFTNVFVKKEKQERPQHVVCQ